jgi:hypothetical protein
VIDAGIAARAWINLQFHSLVTPVVQTTDVTPADFQTIMDGIATRVAAGTLVMKTPNDLLQPVVAVTDRPTTFPLDHYGLIAASGDPADFSDKSSYTSGTVFYTRIWIPAGKPITGLWVGVTDAGVHDGSTTPNYLGLYDDNGVPIDQTANNSALWTAVGWRGGALAAGVIPAQPVGRYVYMGGLARGMSTPPSVGYITSADDFAFQWLGIAGATTKRRNFYAAGQTNLTAAINPVSTGTPTGYIPMFGIS